MNFYQQDNERKKKVFEDALNKEVPDHSNDHFNGDRPACEEPEVPYWCPCCHSHNFRQLGDRLLWHCNDCSREFTR